MRRAYRLSGVLALVGLLVALGLSGCYTYEARQIWEVPTPTVPPLPGSGYGVVTLSNPRLLWLDSYSEDCPWSLQVGRGLSETLAATLDNGGVWREFHMGAEQRAVRTWEEAAAFDAVAEEALQVIADLNPDVVIVSGDEAARIVIPNSTDPNRLFVYCGVKGDPKVYGLVRPNVVGVRETFRPLQTEQIAQAFLGITPTTYIVLSDAFLANREGVKAIYQTLREAMDPASEERPKPLPALRMVERWEQWQQVVRSARGKADFIMIVGFPRLQDAEGQWVGGDEVVAWTVRYSPVPIFGLSELTVYWGAVGGLTSSAYRQGEQAAQIVLRLLAGQHPSSMASWTVGHGVLAIDLGAARRWGLSVPVVFPLAGQVYTGIPVPTQGGHDR